LLNHRFSISQWLRHLLFLSNSNLCVCRHHYANSLDQIFAKQYPNGYHFYFLYILRMSSPLLPSLNTILTFYSHYQVDYSFLGISYHISLIFHCTYPPMHSFIPHCINYAGTVLYIKKLLLVSRNQK